MNPEQKPLESEVAKKERMANEKAFVPLQRTIKDVSLKDIRLAKGSKKESEGTARKENPSPKEKK